MFRNKKNTRVARSESSETFRRNNVVVSRSQREVAERKQSVTQRQIDAKRRARLRRTRRRTWAGLGLVLVVALLMRMRVGGVAASPQDPSLKLSSEAQTEYERGVGEYLNQRIPLRQSWLLNNTSLASAVREQFPEVKNVYIQHTNPISTRLSVRLDFRKPIFVWKGVDGSARYIDSTGVLFSRNYYTGIDVKALPTVEDQGASSSAAGTVIATTKLTQAISQIYAQLPDQYKDQKSSVSKVVLPRSAREVRAYVTGAPYYVVFSTDRPVETQVGELGQLIDYLAQNNITPAEYIDLRVDHKAYYK